MKIFISHALVDKEIAEKVKQLLSSVSLGLVEPWLSSSLDGLKPGDVLWNEIHEQLRESDKIITILTLNSYLRPWLLYESGYVAGSKGANVIPLVFGISKSDLPSPLSAYVVYSVDNEEDLPNLLFQLLSEVVPSPNRELIDIQSQQFINESKNLLDKLSKIEKPDEGKFLDALNIKLIDKLKASEILHRKLSDPNVKKVSIITYTNEVEAGTINHYRVQGNKEIEIFKRSLFADLSEQQSCNLLRIRDGSSVKQWNKFKISLQASKVIEDEFNENENVNVKQFFSDSPPTKRAYLFDETEAIIAYYETAENHYLVGGSAYKGMNKSQALWVTNKTDLGKFFINEIVQTANTLKKSCRTWIQEKKCIKKLAGWRQTVRQPCCCPKVVLLDMDGVLYDSLPNYVTAWKEGFKVIGIEFPEIEVYRQEGRPGRATVESFLQENNINGISNQQIESVLKRKAEILKQLGKSPLQKGATNLVEAIRKTNLGMWVVTGSTKDGIKEQIVNDFSGIIPVKNIIDGNDYTMGKPYPVPFLMASLRAEVCSEDAIVIENAPLGVESADRSGAYCLAVNTGILEDSELELAGARVVFQSCNQLADKWGQIVEELKNHI